MGSVDALLRSRLRDIPDFPKPGIIFKDLTPLLADADAWKTVCDELAAPFKGKKIGRVCGIESRGFLYGVAVAERLGVGFVPVRKPGKLPAKTVRETYALEYGQDSLEMHQDALVAGQEVLVVDDLLATGGTAAATCRLVEKLGAKVHACAFAVELGFLKGREKLPGRKVVSLVTF
ncbi:MAG TPA: adenine phosphoribosyltransferase [Planctomycetota bacterium]|nr:adenine phosphoribosyltransferase [Planctomycetota bacterium]